MKNTIKKIIVLIITIVTVISLSENKVCKADGSLAEGSLYSLSCALIDGDTGRVLYEKNGYEKRAMASTTKIMTLILALEYGNMTDIVTVSSYAAKMPDVQLGIRAGEQYKLEDLIYSMMLESHNDSAVAIAEHIGGDIEKFARMMNDKAKEIGLTDTYFITPNGLDAIDRLGKHSTTAVSLSQLMRYCVMQSDKKEDFIKVCRTKKYSFCDYSGKRSFNVFNHNRFLDMVEGVIAGKTGFTADAGYCYVTAIRNEGRTFIIALLGCGWPGNKNYKWSDAKKLLAYGCENYYYKDILDDGYHIDSIPVCNGIEKENIDVRIDDSVRLIMSNEDKVSIKQKLPVVIEAPVNKDEIVGNLDIYINDEYFKGINVYSCDCVKRTSLRYYFYKVLNDFMIH